jgi:hypothetical protein
MTQSPKPGRPDLVFKGLALIDRLSSPLQQLQTLTRPCLGWATQRSADCSANNADHVSVAFPARGETTNHRVSVTLLSFAETPTSVKRALRCAPRETVLFNSGAPSAGPDVRKTDGSLETGITKSRRAGQPLGQALRECAGAANKERILSVLLPVQRAAERCAWLKPMVDAVENFHPLRWSPQEAFRRPRQAPRRSTARS